MLRSLELWLVGSARGLQNSLVLEDWLKVNGARPAYPELGSGPRASRTLLVEVVRYHLH